MCDSWTLYLYYFPFPSVRNAGNLVPHANLSGHEEITTEPAALELGCVINGIKHVIVCGHSDCKVCDGIYNVLHYLLSISYTVQVFYVTWYIKNLEITI